MRRIMHRRSAWLAAAALPLISALAMGQESPAQESRQQELLAAFYGPPDLTMLTYYSAGWTYLLFDNKEYPNLLRRLGQTAEPNPHRFSHGWGALVTYGRLVAVLESSGIVSRTNTNSTTMHSVDLTADNLSLQIGYAPIKLPAAIGFVTAGAGMQTVGLRGYPKAPGDFDTVVVEGRSDTFSVSANTLVLRASAGFELAVLPPGDPWGVHAGIIAGVAYAPLQPQYRLFGGAGLLDRAPALTGTPHPNLTPWSFSVSLLLGVGGGL